MSSFDLGSVWSEIVASEVKQEKKPKKLSGSWIVSITSNSWSKCAEDIKSKLSKDAYDALVKTIDPYDRESFQHKVKIGREVTVLPSKTTEKDINMYVKGVYETKLFAHLKTLYVRIVSEELP